ncbi:hypothetical protein Fmac_024170 [Flemingia macrophylla]|uniref:Protein SIEVE ELEMENT OCCLUSION B n=1 Tax=Flemingia macrophylla TaxID=520843 RepID=A0ABD1LNM8_9FABA
MSLSKAADSIDTSKLQKPQLPNPFDLSDSQILDKVYLTHLHDEDQCDVDVLLDIVSSVVLKSTRLAEGKAYTVFQPEFRTIKLISCQMINTPRGERYVHQTTICILQYLKSYSWEAKALVTLAAFALEYGNLLHLTEVATPDNQLANSLKQLNQVQIRKDTATNLVVLVMEVLHRIQEWARWSALGYDIQEVPSLSNALTEIPVVVYWTIASLVAATANLIGVSDYGLTNFMERLSLADSRLKEHLISSRKQIDYIEEYLKRKKGLSNPKNIVEFLKLLIQHNGSKVQIYDGSTKNKTDIEVFKQKYVLLFISSLDKIEDEISLLNSIYDRLQENPTEIVQNYKKEDFKILWIPIVALWDDTQRYKFNVLQDKIKWYAVEFFSELPGTELIKEKFNYLDKPIIPVLTPQGEILNEDAMDLIFQWGIDAFPFRKIDGIDLTLKWKWFWDAARKANLGIQFLKKLRGLDSSSSSSFSHDSSFFSSSSYMRSMEFYDCTSFHIKGVEGKFNRICHSLSLSNLEDFSIPVSSGCYSDNKINGFRPPMLKPPPKVRVSIMDDATCSTWNLMQNLGEGDKGSCLVLSDFDDDWEEKEKEEKERERGKANADRYIFIYGGGDKKWIQEFTVAVENTKRHATILNTDTIIDHYQLGKDDPKVVQRFWIEIERKKLKKHKDALDCEVQKIVKTLLCLKQDRQGWAILSKGSNVKVLGHGEPMRQTLVEFESWKEKMLQKEGFDVAFDEYYKTKLDEIYARQQCAYVKNNANVVVTITCPNPTCGRVMEVTSVNYQCCHRDASDNAKI